MVINKKYSSLIFFFFSFFLFSCSSTKNVKSRSVTENFQFYVITPESKEKLLASLSRATPIRGKGGEIFHAYTRYDIRWEFKVKKDSDYKKCRTSNVWTTLKLEFTMPELNSDKADIRSIWSKWYPKLLKHEERHGQFAKDTVLKIEESILSITPQESCEILEKNANKLGYELLDELKEKNKKYDEDTNHGETQGTWINSYF